MALQVRWTLMGQWYIQGLTAQLIQNQEGHGVQEVGFIAFQMTKPSVLTVLRWQEGSDTDPSGECPPH